MDLKFQYSNTSKKQIMVFVNGLLLKEGDDYDWDSIEEEPIFKEDFVDGTWISVITIDTLFGCSRKEYLVEDLATRNSNRVRGGDIDLTGPNIIHHDHRYDEDGNLTGGAISIIAGNATTDGYINIATGHDLTFTAQDYQNWHGNGGNVVITSGEGYGDADGGEVIIRSGKAIRLEAPQVIVGNEEDEWPMSSTYEKS